MVRSGYENLGKVSRVGIAGSDVFAMSLAGDAMPMAGFAIEMLQADRCKIR